MRQNDPDKIIRLVQSSTRNLMGSFRDKTDALRNCSQDIKLLIREGYDKKTAYETAVKLFGRDNVSFIAIDGTVSQDQALDMLVFYAGSFGYIGQLKFEGAGRGCSYDEPVEIESNVSISAAIPVHEQDTASIAGKTTEGGVEVDLERVPSALMHLSEYYMAVKAVTENPDIKVVIMDRTLAGDVGHLVWSVNELLDADACILQGMKTPYGNVTALDLELARMLHPNNGLGIPAARSHLVKYSAISQLLKRSQGAEKAVSYEELLSLIGGKKERLEKLQKDFAKMEERFGMLDKSLGLALKPDVNKYWERVFSASMQVCDYIFNTPEGKHPLIIEHGENGQTKWITAGDLDYLMLVMIYSLVRLAWEKSVLVLGIIKDVAAGEMTKTVVPLLQNAGMLKLAAELPRFSSDKMLLQTASVINASNTSAPWRTFEFDACFRTVAPLADSSARVVNVAGAFKNVISAERMFVKSYMQLWASETDPAVRSHVFSYDRPCYPDFDLDHNELVLHHRDGDIVEEIRAVIHFEHDSKMSHLVMDILCSMAAEVIPECLGHNYPLFLADKKAKTVLEGTKTAYLSTVTFEMAKSGLDQQVLFEAKFREFRSEIESRRRP